MSGEDHARASEPAGDASPAVDLGREFPVADVRASLPHRLLRQSGMWWVTLICTVLAIYLTWRSLPEDGPRITIVFPEGHGLRVEDAVRYRGIDVGVVTDIRLNDMFSGIEVDVTLTPGAAGLNREGTRFWIVRPRLTLTEISGLDTAVGAKYIGLSPGSPANPARSRFEGLPAAPSDELTGDGLDLVLQSTDRGGAETGAPVTWRGVEVGKILAVSLSPDARHVNIGVRINGAYRRLIRSNSRFWVASGFDVDIGLSGLKMNAQSLTTIARGGISFITPAGNGSEETVRSGHVFLLQQAPDQNWLDTAANVPLVEFPLPETVIVTGTRPSSLLGFTRHTAFRQVGVLLARADGLRLLTPQLPLADSDESTDSVLAEFTVEPVGGAPLTVTDVRTDECTTTSAGVMSLPVAADELFDRGTVVPSRRSEEPEDCLVVRSASADGRVTPVIQAIDRSELSAGQDAWVMTNSEKDLTEWHGAPVVAAMDGCLIGLLIVSGNGTVVAGLPDAEAGR